MDQPHQETSLQQVVSDLASGLWAMVLVVAVGCGVFIEVFAEMPLPRWLYVSAGVAIVSCSILASVPKPDRVGLVIIWAGCLTALLGLVVLHLVPWSSRKVFLQDLERVEVGMDRDDVERAMAGYIRGTGWPASPFGGEDAPETFQDVSSGLTHETETTPTGELGLKDSLVFRHSNDGRFNSDWGVVTFRDGRVISVQFMPD